MARLFDDGSNQYLYVQAVPVVNRPLTMACWFNSDDITINQMLMATSSEDVNYEGVWLILRGAEAGDYIQAREYGPGGIGAAVTSSGYSANTWHHACAVFADLDDRRVYIDGGGKGTDVVDVLAEPDKDNVTIGALYYWTGEANEVASPTSGAIAHSAIWNAALNDAEVAILAKGYSPLLVRRGSLVCYYPLIRDTDDDIVGGYSMTPVNAPTVAAHPRVFGRGLPLYCPAAAVAAARRVFVTHW